MGENEAPKAPAGWYPVSDSESGERFWNGEEWTDQYRGMPEIVENKEEKPHKATSKKGWLVSFAVFLVFSIILFTSIFINLSNNDGLKTDQEACNMLSDSIAKVNEQNYQSVSAISSQNQLDQLGDVALLGSQNPDPFGLSQGAKRDDLLMEQLLDFSQTFTFSSDLVEAKDGTFEPGHEPGTSLYRSYQKLQLAVARCSELGFPLENPTFNFEVPLEELQPKKVAPQPQPQVNLNVIPEGFTDAGNGMSYKFIDGTCSYFSCAYVQIYADNTCSNVYVEANTVNADGVILGMTNDMIGAMNPGDSAVATLNILEDAATAVSLTKVQCY